MVRTSIYVFYTFIPLACAECDDSVPFSGASSIPLLYVLFPATLLHQLFFHALSPHLAICFLVRTSIYVIYTFIHSFIPLACAECYNSLPIAGASSVPLCYILFSAKLLHQLFFHPLSIHLAIYFLVYLSILLFPNSYIIPFWESYFLPFSVHAQTNVIYLTLLSLL